MKARRSLQKTLSIGLTVGVTLLWLMGVTASGLVAQHEMNEVFDSALEETAQRILPLAVTDILSRESGAGQKRAPAMEDHEEYLTYLVRDASGQILLQSHDTDISVFGARPKKGFFDTATHRIYGASAVSDTLFIEVAEPLAHRREAAFEAGLALLLPLLFLIPVSLIGVWWAVRFSLRRVVVFRESLESRGSGDLSSVSVEQLPTEFEPIAASINRLLERLRRALESERSFTANSAHELRTPLATALAKVQRLKTELSEETSLQKACEIEDSLRDLARLSQKLLELAKAEGGGVLSEKAQDLVPILQTIIGDYERLEPGRIDIQVPDTQVNSLLNQDAFAILVRNLVENALKHGDTGAPVRVRLSADGTLSVANRGDIIAPDELALLRNRFVRSKTDALGSGLGLAIVEAIVEGAGVQLALHSPAQGQLDGFEAELNIVINR
ncbi:sensor histidine kinase N-terminal domain-containing protein [Marinobacter sediminum]|uniref:sensor histidine kinase n=1 Tax=Marinobacter sediminum TaxID=256323 RepID=UPI00202E1D06|nr:ATP-binding protein [Marinobacter sediminum]MCM0612105.1 sensor histidine kinase N-terminal domain-containing protein [Marinobacter sediminum]